ncbi:YdcF family protein [Lysinibacillus sp. NPDC097195]|uniref:YdcF family protein n=1 Tax=Lysinibacillus sp. NPDC097195 TaxID=3364141 RepID=UPI0037F61182
MLPAMTLLISVFLMLYITEKRRFINAVVLGLIGLTVFIGIATRYDLFINEQGIVSKMGIMTLFGIIPGIMLILSIAMFFNSKILLEKEGRSIRNLVLAVFGLVFLLMMIGYVFIFFTNIENSFWHILFFYAFLIFAYTVFLYTSVMLYSVIYHFTPITYEPHYIIVLGAGLMGDKVPPLLASRLDEAVKQYRKYGERPFIIVSGGQGQDEQISEALAMETYMIERHEIPHRQILREDQSTNTEQNMRFSKAIMDAHAQGREYRALFVTNNFHVFRASIYARKAKLDAQGVGSKTAYYYLPNAFTREFIGLLEMSKWLHVTFFFVLTLFIGLMLRAYV